MTATNVPLLDAYLEAFRARDLERCIQCYAEGALLEFAGSSCRDRQALENWHRDRFLANVAVLRIDGVAADGAVVTVDGTVTSDRLKTWRISALPARAKFVLRDGKIAEARFGARR